jgi:hypothetical protein
MNTIILAFSGIHLLCLAAIFVILVITINKVLQETAFFKSAVASAVVAVCVSLLSIIGMVQLFAPGDGVNASSVDNLDKSSGFDFILLPYIALGIAIIVILLLKFILGKTDRYSSRRVNKEYPQYIEKEHSSESNNVAQKNDHEESRIRK